MQRSDLVALLASGGVSPRYLESSTDEPAEQVPKYSGMLDPSGAETLGRALADVLRTYRPTSVLIWEDPPDLILAHIVARELSATVVRAFDADGLVSFTGAFPPEARVVLLADTFRDRGVVKALTALVHQQGGTPVATAELFTAPVLAALTESGLPAVVLGHADRPAAHGAVDPTDHPRSGQITG